MGFDGCRRIEEEEEEKREFFHFPRSLETGLGSSCDVFIALHYDMQFI